VTTKHFFQFQEERQISSELATSFLRNLSFNCSSMFEEWISVRKAMLAGHFAQHDLLNSLFYAGISKGSSVVGSGYKLQMVN
jgi:hypothetical protein